MLKYLYKYINSKVDVKSLENDNREEQPEEMIQKYNEYCKERNEGLNNWIEDKTKQSEILKEIDKPKTLGKRN